LGKKCAGEGGGEELGTESQKQIGGEQSVVFAKVPKPQGLEEKKERMWRGGKQKRRGGGSGRGKKGGKQKGDAQLFLKWRKEPK